MALRARQRQPCGSAARSSSPAKVNLERGGEREVEAERSTCRQLSAQSCSPGSRLQQHNGFHLACRLRGHLSGPPSPRPTPFLLPAPHPAPPPSSSCLGSPTCKLSVFCGRVFICEQTPRTQIALIYGEFTLYFQRNCRKFSNVASLVTFLPTRQRPQKFMSS